MTKGDEHEGLFDSGDHNRHVISVSDNFFFNDNSSINFNR